VNGIVEQTRLRVRCAVAGSLLALAACTSEPPAPAAPPAASPPAAPAETGATASVAPKPIKAETGLASYYSRRFDGKETAGGDTFRNEELVAAHPNLPLGTIVRVVNLEADRAVEVEITDRGPSAENRREGVIIDVSQAAAARLGMKKDGRVKVRVEVLELGDQRHKPMPEVKRKQKSAG
jgi:rare lipoprotein A